MSNCRITKMQVLVYIIAGLYSLKRFGICTEVSNHNTSDGDLFNFDTSKNFHTEEQIYLETTQISNTFNYNLSKSYAKEFLKPVPLISDPLFEDTSSNKTFKEQSRKRDIPEYGLSHENKMQILQLHNLYRSNVTPSAGDMSYMEWDEELARLAQIWADGCLFDHGMPDNDYPGFIGQNLYIGTDSTGYMGLYMWYEEYLNYDLRKDYCIPGKQCGHYVQMAWSKSHKLGCGRAKCDLRYYLVCHYFPTALKGTQMFQVANPCSQCPQKEGTLCLKNLCITSEQCKNNPFDCQFAKCNLECQNCGRLDKKTCMCECADGWDSSDCSHLCMDKHKRCGKNPGWPSKASCALNNHAVANTYCRKMCEMCHSLNTSVSSNTCCEGKLCDDGFVLDNSCKCTLLCPGSLCDSEETGKYQPLTENDANYLSIPSFAGWIIFLALYTKIRSLWKDF